MHPLQVVVLLRALLYAVQSTVSLFQAQGIRSKRQSCSDTAGTAKKCQELENPRKDEEGQEEEVTEEPKRSMTQEMARGFSLFEEALLVLRHRTQT